MENKVAMSREEFAQAFLKQQEKLQKEEVNKKYDERRMQKYDEGSLYAIQSITKYKSGSKRRRRKRGAI